MNRYQRINTAHKVDGYYRPPAACDHIHETPEQRFETARRECVFHLERALNDVRNMTFEQFVQGRAGK